MKRVPRGQYTERPKRVLLIGPTKVTFDQGFLSTIAVAPSTPVDVNFDLVSSRPGVSCCRSVIQCRGQEAETACGHLGSLTAPPVHL